MATFHFAALVTVIVGTVACFLIRGGRADRSLKSILFAFVPFLLVGIMSGLVLSANGVPTVEWLVPAICVLLLGLFCTSHQVFSAARWSLLAMTIGLCGNFFELTSSGYVADARRAKAQTTQLNRVAVFIESNKLRARHSPETMLPAGPIGPVTIRFAETEWHTPLTRLHRVRRSKAVVWYPGGPVSEGADKLRIKAL